MPEQLTKHPEVTLEVLRSAGAKCADGSPQLILTTCPGDRFCKLPGGEMCVYGLNDATKMTQITAAEWAALSVPVPREPATAPAPTAGGAVLVGSAGLLVGVGVGLAAARAGGTNAAPLDVSPGTA